MARSTRQRVTVKQNGRSTVRKTVTITRTLKPRAYRPGTGRPSAVK